MDKEKIKVQLKIDEGIRFVVYSDSLGLPTVGVGHLCLRSDNLKIGDTITEKQCNYFLEKDLQSAITSAFRLFPQLSTLPEAVQNVIINIAFNLGYTRLSGFHNFVAAVNRGNWKIAAREMGNSEWAFQVGARARRLQKEILSIKENV